MASPKTYLITGCSSGLGYTLAIAALKAGHKVIATARNPAKSPAQVQEITNLGGNWATLDVASPELESQFNHIVATFLPTGKLDVLINNAGFANGAVIEHLDMEASRSVFETNFWGLVRLTQLALPALKAQGGGASIVNVSSTSALFPVPVTSIYSASKAAVDAFTFSLAMEVAHFGIKVLLVTPAGMRTPFIQKGSASSDDTKPLIPEDYLGSQVEMIAKMVLDPAHYVIDPVKAAETIVQAVDATGAFEKAPTDFVRLPLGGKSLEALAARSGELKSTAEAWSDVAKGVDLDE